MKIFYFSPVAWSWIKQRPHFTASLLAKNGAEVVFFHCFPLGRGHFCERRSDGLTVRERGLLPFSLRFPIIERLNIQLMRHWILRKLDADIVILTDPRQLAFLPDAVREHTPLIYDCMDMQPYFHQGEIRRRLLESEEKLLRTVRAVIASSDYIKETLGRSGCIAPKRISVVRNALSDTFCRTETPHASAFRNGAPRMLYAGTADRWLDWPLLLKCAQNFPAAEILLVGPVQYAPKQLPPNIRLHGAVRHEELWNFLNDADLLLLPFQVTELNRGVDPVKLYEYLAAEKPVLSSYWEELDYFAGEKQLHFYRSTEEFMELVQRWRLLKEQGGGSTKFLAENTWSTRIKLYQDILERVTTQKETLFSDDDLANAQR